MARVDKILSEEAKSLFPIKNIASLEKLFNLLINETDPNIGLISILLGILEYSLTNTSVVQSAIEHKAQKSNSITVAGTEEEKMEPLSSPLPNKPISVVAKKSLIMKRRNSKKPSQRIKIFEEDDEQSPIDKQDFPAIELNIVLSLYEQFHANIYSSVNMNLLPSKSEAETGSESNDKNGTSRELIKHVLDIVWNSLSKTYDFEKPHLQSIYTYLTGNKVDSFGFVISVLAACQLLQINDAHLVLSEDHAWLCFGQNGEFDSEITWHGKSNEDKRGQRVSGENHKSWLYLNGHPVKCTRHMEVAAVIASINPSINATTDSMELMLIQQKLLWLMYDAGYMQKYPMAIGTLADLEELYPSKDRKLPSVLFEEGITIAKQYYENTHVYPYTFYGQYLYRQQKFKAALEYWAAGAHVLGQYRYDIKDDEEIYKDYLDITKDYIPLIMKQCTEGISADSLTRDPFSFAQLLRLFDGICVWEETTGSVPIVHIIWAKNWINAITKFDSSIRKRVTILTKEKDGGTNKGSSSDIEYKGDGAGAGTGISSSVEAEAGSSSDDKNLELSNNDSLLSAFDFPSITSVITSTALSATELVCDISMGSILSSMIPFSSSSAKPVISTNSASSSSVSPSFSSSALQVSIAQLAKSSTEILVDSNSIPIISTFASSSSKGSSGTSETNNNIASIAEQRLLLTSPINWSTDENGESCVTIQLYSRKMKSIADMLQVEKFKTSTLTLMLTAQTFSVKPPSEIPESNSVRSRRSRTAVRNEQQSSRITSKEQVKTVKRHSQNIESTNISGGGAEDEEIDNNNQEISLPPKKRSRKM